MKSRTAKILNALLFASLLTAMLGVQPAHAAAIIVNSSADTVADNASCTLREAIIAANTNTASGGLPGECPAGDASATDVITLTSGVTYSLTLNSTNEDVSADGDLDIINNAGVALDLQIVVSGATNAIISQDAAIDDRVFDIFIGATVQMTNLTITGGSIAGNGGGIRNNGTLTITNSTLSTNSAATDGGGILNNGTATLTNSTISANVATFNGGGISNNGAVTITNSTLSGNSATASGGGILNTGNVTLTGSTLSGNSAGFDGGGILNFSNSVATITNSTLSGNSANTNGGGIANSANSSVTLTNSTLSRNLANNGGGIANVTGTVTITNSIVALQTSGADCTGTITSGSNNIESGTSCSFVQAGDQQNTDPLLGPLANNGGPTQTHALLTSPFISPAINAGNALICANPPVNNQDQRGTLRPQGTACDIGAYELIVQVVPTPTPTAIPTATPTPTLPVPVTGGSLPNTGFAPNRITSLPAQPASLAYTALGDIWLEIPALNVKTSIVGIPKSKNTWNVDWLGKDAGWLHGTAFPSWEGNSVLTAHVYDANGLPGPFVNLKDLKYGDQIIVHMYGEKYIFELREVRTVQPTSTRYALKHLEDYSYLTLITCQFYDEKTDAYRYRRVVRAVLVNVQAQ